MTAANDVATKVEALFSGAARRPLALVGRSGSGKTTLLRRAAGASEVVWSTARDLAQELVEAAREERSAAFGAALAADSRPLCVEHVEDLRGKEMTQRELGLMLQAAAWRRPVVLSLTREADDADVLRWLSSWAEVVEVRGSPQPGTGLPAFDRYIGIDYSGAEAPTSSLPGLRIYVAEGTKAPVEVEPPPSPRKYFTRRGIAEWLIDRLGEDVPTLVGIDHGFSFPMAYFKRHRLPPDWPAFLDDFQRHWPTDGDYMCVDFVRDGLHGNGGARGGSAKWRRLTEVRARAKSVFQFDGHGTIAKSTHAGLPWLRRIRQALGERVHFWPFDGWSIPPGKSAVVEVYPRLWKGMGAEDGMTGDQRDACAVAEWMRLTDAEGGLPVYLEPRLSPEERAVAGVEGWILGVQ